MSEEHRCTEECIAQLEDIVSQLQTEHQEDLARIVQLEEALRPLVYGKTTYLYEGAGMNEPDFICVYCEYSVGDGHSLDCPIPRGRDALSPSEQEKEEEDG